MARIVIPNAPTTTTTNAPVLYGPNGQALTPNGQAPNGQAPRAPRAPREPRAPRAPGMVGGFPPTAKPTLAGAGAVPGYNPHRPTGVVDRRPTGTRYDAWQHMVTTCNAGGTLADYAAGGPHCKAKYVARWVAAGLLTVA